MNCHEKGKIVENEFKLALSNVMENKNMDFSIEKTSFKDDVNNHIDFYLKYNDEIRSFDVKARKKINREDKKENNELNWVELKNVNGKDGWIYGKATHIAFETEDGFMLVKRKDLIKLIEEKCVDATIYNSKEYKDKEIYKKYNREGRKDIIILVPNKDINKIKETYIKKVL